MNLEKDKKARKNAEAPLGTEQPTYGAVENGLDSSSTTNVTLLHRDNVVRPSWRMMATAFCCVALLGFLYYYSNTTPAIKNVEIWGRKKPPPKKKPYESAPVPDNNYPIPQPTPKPTPEPTSEPAPGPASAPAPGPAPGPGSAPAPGP